MPTITDEVEQIIEKALKKGNTIELKKERGKLTVIEIERKVKIKTAATGLGETVDRD